MKLDMINGGITAAKGFQAGGVHCGIRRNQTKRDLALIFSSAPCSAAAVYTQNLVKGAPLTVTQRNLRDNRARAVIVNSGNANTCNADGIEKAERMCEIAGEILEISPQDVIVASTGVIGQTLPIEPIENAAVQLRDALSPEGSLAAATAIMTTDKVPKEAAVRFGIDGKTVKIGGIAKGSGMIHPNMATLLSFVTTDCDISAQMLQKATKKVADDTFNMISIDGDTSTNDMFVLLANGLAGNAQIADEGEEFDLFCAALDKVCRKLALMMAGDGEGATRLVICNINGAADDETARKAAKSVIGSALIKTAMFGMDANWGRVLCALGYSGAALDTEKIEVAFRSKGGEIIVCKNGKGVDFSEVKAKEILSEEEINIDVSLHMGDKSAQAYGCDLSYEYVRINGDYRT